MNNIWWVCNGRCANLSSNFLLSLKMEKHDEYASKSVPGWVDWDGDLTDNSKILKNDLMVVAAGEVQSSCGSMGSMTCSVHLVPTFTCTHDLSRTFHSFCSSASMGFASWLQQGVKDPVNIDKIQAFLTQEFWKNIFVFCFCVFCFGEGSLIEVWAVCTVEQLCISTCPVLCAMTEINTLVQYSLMTHPMWVACHA